MVDKKDDPAIDLDDDLGSDWESAFQAEDYMFSPEEGDDFFLGGEDSEFTTTSAYEFTPPSEEELESLPDFDTEAGEEAAATAAPAAEEAAATAALSAFLAALAALWTPLRERFTALPRLQQIGAGVIGLCLILAAGWLLLGHEAEVPPEAAAPAGGQAALVGEAPADAGAAPAAPEKVRRKWPFPAFVIPVAGENGAAPSLLTVDITLIAALDPDEPLPEERAVRVRDLIYQFYANRPRQELRRYALARGEMQRQLRAWLLKEWPDAPIETIVFDHYQLL